MRKTKIICTIGPACEDVETLTKMCEAGMNVARLNFSHGTHEEHLKKINLVKEVRESLNLPIPIMLDTKGPEYRIKTFKDHKVTLAEGAEFIFTTLDVEGDETKVSVNYEHLCEELSVVAELCTCVVNEASLDLSVIVKAVHFDTLGVALRIAAARHNYAGTASLVPFYINLVEFMVINSLENLIEVSVKHGEDYLCFGVTEAAVILYYLWSLRSDHETEVETALKSSALSIHSVHGREENLFHALLCYLVGVVGVRRDSAHSACIQTLVTVECTLMVHRRYHRHHSFAVSE